MLSLRRSWLGLFLLLGETGQECFHSSAEVLCPAVIETGNRTATLEKARDHDTFLTKACMPNHQKIDLRSRALALAVAEELRRQPDLVEVARRNVSTWMKTSSSGIRSTLEEWNDALKGSTEQVIELLTGEEERAVRLRQSNPFAGVLSSKQRTEILNRF